MIFKDLATKQKKYSANNLNTWVQILAPLFNSYFTSMSMCSHLKNR